jgi:hypothetical protein
VSIVRVFVADGVLIEDNLAQLDLDPQSPRAQSPDPVWAHAMWTEFGRTSSTRMRFRARTATPTSAPTRAEITFMVVPLRWLSRSKIVVTAECGYDLAL